MGSVTIVAVPEADGAPLPEHVLGRLVRAATVVAHSAGAPARALREAGIGFATLADLGLDADAPTDRLVTALLERSAAGDVALAVSGYPFMRAGFVSGLLSRGDGVSVVAERSPLQVLLMAFDIDLTADLDIIDARSLRGFEPARDSHLIVVGVGTPIAARAVAERLRPTYPEDHRVVVARLGADGALHLSLWPLSDLETLDVETDTAVYVPPNRIRPPGGFDEFVRIIGVLRGPDGCPWDLAQTHVSLRQNMLEEAYEAVHAIDAGDPAGLADELGDVLLQVVLQARIAEDSGTFTVDDVVATISEKIRRRHPHIFGDASAATPEEVAHRWDAIKNAERPGTSVLDGATPTLPALMYAQRISRRAVSVGFEWESLDGVWAKVHEEIDELKATEPGSAQAEAEIGDVLFTVVNLARKQGIDAEQALRGACARFQERFRAMEASATDAGTPLAGMDIEGMERLWQAAKARASAAAGDEGAGSG